VQTNATEKAQQKKSDSHGSVSTKRQVSSLDSAATAANGLASDNGIRRRNVTKHQQPDK
jgi:hypothetical protein